MVVQDQDQIASPVQFRQQRGYASGKIGKDDDFALLLVNPVQQRRIRFFQAEALHFKAGSFKSPVENGSGAESVRVVVMKYLDAFFRPLHDLPDGRLHVMD